MMIKFEHASVAYAAMVCSLWPCIVALPTSRHACADDVQVQAPIRRRGSPEESVAMDERPGVTDGPGRDGTDVVVMSDHVQCNEHREGRRQPWEW